MPAISEADRSLFRSLALSLLCLSCDASPRSKGQAVPSAASPAPSARAATMGSAAHTPHTGVVPADDPACARLPIFKTYERAKAVVRRGPRDIVLRLRIDLHAADCGAPDCYGEDTELTLAFRANNGRCEIVEASSRSEPFGDCGAPEKRKPWTNRFSVTGAPNLADLKLDRVELRDDERRQAFVLLPDNYFFFDPAPAGASLHPRLERDEDTGCCYGFTSAESGRWSLQFWASPLAVGEVGEGSDLAAFNRWATESDIRDDLDELARRGFRLSRADRVLVKTSGGDPATNATVTIEDFGEPHEDFRVRRSVLQFSREACATCRTGATGWWLYKLSSTQACRAGQGHEDFSSEPCF